MDNLPEIITKITKKYQIKLPLSLPLRLAIESGIITENTTILEWKKGTPHHNADIVNLGYILNRIKSPQKQEKTLITAWKLTCQVLLVAAPVRINDESITQIICEDGIFINSYISEPNYNQLELQTYIEETLNTPAIPVSPGIFFIFRDIAKLEHFLFTRFTSNNHLQELSPTAATENLAKQKRRQDLLIYLALHPNITEITPQLYQEIITLFDNLETAKTIATEMLASIQDFNLIQTYCQISALGKLLPGALYIHISAFNYLHPLLRLYENYATRHIGRINGANLIKINTEQPRISYLFYPDFDTEAHPILKASIQLDITTGNLTYRDYEDSENPPILHRKETFVTPQYPNYQEFKQLTKQEVRLGLLNNTYPIGTLKGWLECLQKYGLEIDGHQVIQRQNGIIQIAIPKIERHRAAMMRNELSRPIRLALEAGLFKENTTFFDYGCGYGGDVDRIAQRGYNSAGWDPYYFPNNPCNSADIVNLGYVINVIECLTERQQALIKAWELTQEVLIVAAQVLIDERNTNGKIAFGDGVITRRNTFQKYYEQSELKTYIDQILNVDAVPIALGIYLVFRHEEQKENFSLYRFRSRTTTPRIITNSKKFADYQNLLNPLMEFITKRGRLPRKQELALEADIKAEFGTYYRAFQVILQVTKQEDWDAISYKRSQDLLVYLALSNFTESLQHSKLPTEVREDIKALFGSYKEAWYLADKMLFSLRDKTGIAKVCQESKIGLKLPTSLSIHISALSELDPFLRLYEGCASRTIGRLDGTNIIRFHINKPIISYQFYPDFDTDPHPVLDTSVQIDLRNLHVSYRDYSEETNPPILHRKDSLVTPEYPHYDKFAKLTELEEKWGLLDDLYAIKNRQSWLQFLDANCAEIRNNRVYWRKDADPYRVKFLLSLRRSRQKNKPE